jgi:hypothetical protein
MKRLMHSKWRWFVLSAALALPGVAMAAGPVMRLIPCFPHCPICP